MKNYFRKILAAILIVSMCTITGTMFTTAAESQISVHFIDVGQGDSIFIDAGDYDILIDGGDNSQGETVVNYLNDLNTDDIEILISTHPHADHVGGLDDVLEAFDVEKVIYSGKSYTSQTYKDYWSAVINEDCEYMKDDDMEFEIFDGAVLKIIETGDSWSDTNNYSVVCALDYNNIEFLFTGDMESEAEYAALDKFFDVEVLKVGHHGSSSSSSSQFLAKTKPEYAVISCGEDNSYGHPHEETLEKLSDIGAEIYRTDLNGTIVARTDGSTVTFD